MPELQVMVSDLGSRIVQPNEAAIAILQAGSLARIPNQANHLGTEDDISRIGEGLRGADLLNGLAPAALIPGGRMGPVSDEELPAGHAHGVLGGGLHEASHVEDADRPRPQRDLQQARMGSSPPPG